MPEPTYETQPSRGRPGPLCVFRLPFPLDRCGEEERSAGRGARTGLAQRVTCCGGAALESGPVVYRLAGYRVQDERGWVWVPEVEHGIQGARESVEGLVTDPAQA